MYFVSENGDLTGECEISNNWILVRKLILIRSNK